MKIPLKRTVDVLHKIIVEYFLTNRHVQIIIGTPGRVLDVLNRNTYLVLRELEVLVLDEGELLINAHYYLNGVKFDFDQGF